MGPNGSGKSTLVRAITGLHELARGEVLLFGTPLAQFAEHDRIGFVPQRASAAGGVPASVWEVVTSGRLTKRRLFRRLSRDDRRAVHAALDVVGLADRASDSVSELSGGQQQRVLIARALASEPDLFFLDEPTAGVDLASQEALAKALGTLSRRGATIVLVAHELGPLAPLVDRAVTMADGRIVYDGAPLGDHGAPGHHHSREVRHDHAPHVAAPLDDRSGGAP
jgi:zinc transport system ATP-binding protein